MDNVQPKNVEDDNLDNNYFEHVELAPMGEQKNESDVVSYTNRLHSIHRNRLSNNKRGDLEKSLDARTGGVNGRTLKWPRATGDMAELIENHAELIVAKMEQDALLMEDSPTSEELRREALRDMPQSLTLKRCVKEKLSKSVSQKSKRKPLGCFKMFKYRMSIGVSKFKISMKNLAYTFELWYGTVKQIEGNFGSGVANFFKFLRWIFILNAIMALVSFSFIVIPQIIFTVRNGTLFDGFDVEDIFTGEGYLTNSFLYYGFYTNLTITEATLPYRIPDAYFYTMVCLYLCCFAVLSISVALDYRRSFIETEGGLKYVFAQKIFCGWDYNIATDDAALLKSRAIYNDLRELLYDVMYESHEDPFIVIFWTGTMQVMMNILVVLSLAGSGYLMWFLMDMAMKEHWSSMYSAIVVNLIMTLLPIVFSWVINYEGYKTPKTKLFLTLVRTFVLGFVIIGVLVTFWLKNPDGECWETSLGQETYRLILFDFIFSIIVLPLIDLVSYCFCRLMGEGQLHFDIARHTMQIIYNQTLFWVGFFFSPFLAVIIVVKLLIMWYVRKTIVLKFCRPSSKTWRAAQTTTWFLMMSFLSLLLVMGLLGYIITSTPTTNCGPFRDYDYVYEIVTFGLLQLREHSKVLNILLFVTKPGFIALVLIALCGRVYYIRAKAQAQRGIVAIYREMLVWEARDKEFLLQKIALVTKGEWKYKLQEGREHNPITSQKGAPRLKGLQGDFIREPSRSSLTSSAAGPSDADNDFSSYKKNS
ncbi:transmembrane channel-like protein 3 isoform X2 [Anoplophora glabripennis]|nr:transmembrane channel-like protein 3 isoform X2 [Anoplophora glabripennis]XP_018570842.1 transmembrane channel-like protein 3 isoform X2 [Anoplophora glabripennis]